MIAPCQIVMSFIRPNEQRALKRAIIKRIAGSPLYALKISPILSEIRSFDNPTDFMSTGRTVIEVEIGPLDTKQKKRKARP